MHVQRFTSTLRYAEVFEYQIEMPRGVQAVLSAANILPSATQSYTLQAINAAMMSVYNVSAHLQCDGQGELTELWLCVDRNLEVVDCSEFEQSHTLASSAAHGSDGGSLRSKQDKGGRPSCDHVFLPPFGDSPPAGGGGCGGKVASSQGAGGASLCSGDASLPQAALSTPARHGAASVGAALSAAARQVGSGVQRHGACFAVMGLAAALLVGLSLGVVRCCRSCGASGRCCGQALGNSCVPERTPLLQSGDIHGAAAC